MIRRQAVKNTDNPPGQVVIKKIYISFDKVSVTTKEEHQKLKDNALLPKEVMMSDLARDEYNRIGHTEYMKKYRKE